MAFFSASCCLDITNGAVRVIARWENVLVDGVNARDPSTNAETGDVTAQPEPDGSMTFWFDSHIPVGDNIIVTFYDGFTQVGQVSINYTGVACAD